MGIFSKKKTTASDTLDDISYIADFHHEEGLWHQYDFLLAARGYGWDYMVNTAEYMANAELTDIGTVSVTATLGEKSSERIEEYKTFGSIKAMPSLSVEGASLGIGGMSN
ncbi:MAG: hypothetical protein HUJ58_05995, partial [Erysipelotrichaceae bacterium]|nr:hypothetical protein [Erysipelotrichaceae bacterium]